MGIFGGFIDQVSNYSFGTALVFLASRRRQRAGLHRAAHLVVVDRAPRQADGDVRRRQPKNMQVTQRRHKAHAIGQSLAELARAGVAVVNVSPIREDGPAAVTPEWIAIRPGTDTAMLLALTHTLIANSAGTTGFPRALQRRLRARARLRDGRERRPAEGRRLGGGDHRRSGRHHPRAGAPHGGKPHHDHRVMVAAARRSRRAALLGGDPAGLVARPDRPAGRRLRLRLRLRFRHRQRRPAFRAPGDGSTAQPGQP